MDLKDKRILMTGGAGGLGVLLSDLLRGAGAKLTVIDKVQHCPIDCTYLRGDLSTTAGINSLIAEISSEPWDILINLAGIQYFGPLESQSAEHLEKTFIINLVAPALLARGIVPGMKQRGFGQIVNIGSVFGSINFAHFVSYSSSKAGLKGLSQALRRELAGSGVGVTYVAPRAMNTPLSSSLIRQFANLTKMQLDEPSEVAERIITAIRHRKREVYIGFRESVFVLVNAIVPGLADAVLAAGDNKARRLFAD